MFMILSLVLTLVDKLSLSSSSDVLVSLTCDHLVLINSVVMSLR